MHQTTLGLDYLHGLEGGFIHRNIHGRNVLVAEIPSSSDTHYVVKLSDFRFGKPALKDAQNSLTKSSSGWIAPEMNDPMAMLGPWTDVFILGCFFYYVLSGGDHPFGRNVDQPNRDRNITNGNYAPGCWDDDKLSTKKFTDLIKDMTKHSAAERTSMSQVLQHFQRDAGYFPLYARVDQGVKPGLCVIINQIEFTNIPDVRNTFYSKSFFKN
jgi:serine/threonine-protein kinase/endoribonuclease IRE1